MMLGWIRSGAVWLELDAESRQISFVLDTGFEGFLKISPALANSIGVVPMERHVFRLADNTLTEFFAGEAAIIDVERNQ